MIDQKDLLEIRSRDFLEKRDHYVKYQDVQSRLLYGEYMHKTPIITIVMPIYNHPHKCLEAAIISAVNQNTGYDYQILIVDNDADGANNNLAVIKKIDSSKIIYFRNETNIGIFGNWNKCVLLSKTKWITFLHSDDILGSDFIDVMCNEILKNTSICLLSCKIVNYDIDDYNIDTLQELSKNNDKSKMKRVQFEEYIDRMATSVKGSLINRSYLIDIGGFADMNDGLGLSDYPAMLKYCYYYNIYTIDKILYFNGWGKNDSLNISHWYPEIVANYYMQMFFYNQKPKFIRVLYSIRCAHRAYSTATQYNSGNNFLGKVIPVDMLQLQKDCCIRRKPNIMYTFIGKAMSFIKKTKLKLHAEYIS